MIETLNIFWNAPIELRVLILIALAVPLSFLVYYYKEKWFK